MEHGAPSSGDLFWTGTLFLPGERSQPAAPDGVCLDAGTDYPESRLVSLLDQLHVSSELAVDLESVGSTDPMLVDSDTASLDAFPTNVVIINDALPRADSGSSAVTEVLVIRHVSNSGENARDA